MSIKKEVAEAKAAKARLIGQTDLAIENMKEAGRQVGSYYTALLNNGVPEEVARLLMLQWHPLFWTAEDPGTMGFSEDEDE